MITAEEKAEAFQLRLQWGLVCPDQTLAVRLDTLVRRFLTY